jgi:hypothetical protein
VFSSRLKDASDGPLTQARRRLPSSPKKAHTALSRLQLPPWTEALLLLDAAPDLHQVRDRSSPRKRLTGPHAYGSVTHMPDRLTGTDDRVEVITLVHRGTTLEARGEDPHRRGGIYPAVRYRLWHASTALPASNRSLGAGCAHRRHGWRGGCARLGLQPVGSPGCANFGPSYRCDGRLMVSKSRYSTAFFALPRLYWMASARLLI